VSVFQYSHGSVSLCLIANMSVRNSPPDNFKRPTVGGMALDILCLEPIHGYTTKSVTSNHQIYTVSGKKGATLFLPVTLRNANDFQNSFTITLCSKFAVKESINILS